MHRTLRTLAGSLVAAVVLSGVMTFGAAGTAGMAGAASTGTAPSATRCARAEKLATRIQTLEKKADTWLPQAEKRESAATAASHTKLAQRIEKRITRVQKRITRAQKLLARIDQVCGSAAPAAGSGTAFSATT